MHNQFISEKSQSSKADSPHLGHTWFGKVVFGQLMTLPNHHQIDRNGEFQKHTSRNRLNIICSNGCCAACCFVYSCVDFLEFALCLTYLNWNNYGNNTIFLNKMWIGITLCVCFAGSLFHSIRTTEPVFKSISLNIVPMSCAAIYRAFLFGYFRHLRNRICPLHISW